MIIRYLNYSGAPKIFLWIAKSLAEKGHEVTICTFNTPSDIKMSDSIKWIDLTSEHLGFFGLIYRIRTIIKQGKYDVSISFLLDGNVYNMFACYGLKTKSIVCERNDPYKPHYYKLKFWKPWFRLADGAVFQLPKVSEFYSNIKAPTAIIPNPIIEKDNIECTPFENRNKNIATHGRLDNIQKRHDVLIRAFALLHQNYPDYTLSIFGSDGDRLKSNEKKLKALIAELDIEEYVKLEGETDTPKKAIKDSKLWILSSDFEGIPNSLIEAMSIGLPCISTDCSPGGARFLIKDGDNGCLVEKGDIQGLYKKMKYLIEHPLIAESIGKEAMKIKHVLSPNAIIEKWESFLLKLCEKEKS